MLREYALRFLGCFHVLIDISAEYDPIHPPDAIKNNLPPEKQYEWPIRYNLHMLTYHGIK